MQTVVFPDSTEMVVNDFARYETDDLGGLTVHLVVGDTRTAALLVVGLGRFELPTFGPPDRCTPNR